MPDFQLESALLDGRDGAARVIGLDEAGRGPWAGPVVAAAVWLDPARLPRALLHGLDDCKKVPPPRREALFATLGACAADAGLGFALGEASAAEIDRLNVLQASLLAMTRAVAGLGFRPEMALVDGDRAPDLPCPAETVIGGDGRSLSIAAASIIAKVTRDRMMRELARRHPGYGWERNAGYGTAEHRAAIGRLGITPEHRRSFRPVREALTISH